MLNLESVALMVSEKLCLDMTGSWKDGRREMAKSIFLVAQIKNTLYCLTCLLRPVTYIMPKLIRPFFSFEEKAGLKSEKIYGISFEIKVKRGRRKVKIRMWSWCWSLGLILRHWRFWSFGNLEVGCSKSNSSMPECEYTELSLNFTDLWGRAFYTKK